MNKEGTKDEEHQFELLFELIFMLFCPLLSLLNCVPIISLQGKMEPGALHLG